MKSFVNIVFICLGMTVFVVLLVLACLGAVFMTREERQRRREHPLPPLVRSKWWHRHRRRAQEAAQEAAQPSGPTPATLRLDPERPPSWKRVKRVRPGHEHRCSCHDRPFAEGDNVLWWPEPPVTPGDPYTVTLLCEETAGKPTTWGEATSA